ncbi:MAG: hypothetical protein WBO36_07555 [Saprospiraceae bacterium]
MKHHILNGDCLLEIFRPTDISGEVIVDREALIDGDVSGHTLEDFWKIRESYLVTTYGIVGGAYTVKVIPEFHKIIHAPPASEFDLWFGYDLFCQVNMWFVLSLIKDRNKNDTINIIHPSYLSVEEIWNDFGSATPQDLVNCLNQRVKVTTKDLALGQHLWLAYKNHDLTALKKLSATVSACFPNLVQICQAHIDRYIFSDGKNRLEMVIKDIINSSNDFNKVFAEFTKREGIYGFGDLQVKKIYDKVLSGL